MAEVVYSIANGQEHSPEFVPAASGEGVLCSMQYAFWYRSRRKTRAPGSDRERAAHIAKAQSCLGRINRVVAAGCAIDKVTSAEIATNLGC